MPVIIDKVDLIETRNGNYTIKVIGDDGSQRTLHSLYDPESEARSIVDKFQFSGKGVLVVLGLGLGYHVAELSRRFPEAEIIVIEFAREIYGLAKEHGPVLGDTEVISGLLPEEALGEIAKRQTRDGIAPLAVFPLSSAVSAFSSYYQPILELLRKTESVRLWERLKYSKFKLDKLKVVMIDTGYFLVHEVEKALKSLNHEVLRVPVADNGNGDAIISSFLEAIVNFKPDFILTMNHLGFDEQGKITDFLKSIEMPVASWFVDSPRLIVEAFQENVSPWCSLFLWDRIYRKGMEDMGFDSVIYLPLGTDESLFKPLTARKHRKKLGKYSCDISFVGNSMVEPVNEWMAKNEAGLHIVIEETAHEVAFSPGIKGDRMGLTPVMESAQIKGLSGKEKMNFEAAVLWKATLLYRLASVNALEGFGLTVHGDHGWSSIMDSRDMRLQPPLNYYKDLPFLYNACKVNFNATSRQMRQAVNQRVFDAPACEAFLLTDHQEALEDLFEPGKEIISYRHRDEIPVIAKFYLKYSSEREAIARKGRERVMKEHTY